MDSAELCWRRSANGMCSAFHPPRGSSKSIRCRSDRKSMILNHTCPLCEQNQYSLLYDNPGGWSSHNGNPAKFYVCEGCGLVARLPAEQTMEDFYQLEYWGERDLSPARFLKVSPRHSR